LYGKKTTHSKITEEINALLNGNSSRPDHLSVAEIAKVLGVCKKTVYNYINKIPKQESIARLSSGHFALPKNPDSKYRHFNKHHKITSDPLVAEWMSDLLTRRQGNPIKSWKTRLRSLETVCNTCKVNPRDLIVSRKNTEKIMRSFAKHYHNGKVKQSHVGKKSEGFGYTIYIRVQGVRDFCAFYDITWRRGMSGVMSQKVPGHGKYADIRFTDEEFDAADNFIKEQWGVDSDIYRWFWIGVESCARFNALYSMSNQYSKHQSPSGKIIYVMTAFETKTEYIRGGKWKKFITRENTQISIDLLKSRGYNTIFESELSKSKFKKDIHKKLFLIYKHLGKTENYFSSHATHVLRHIGAHYWLSKTNYNYGIISEVGGWNTIDELKKSYGQIPPEKILEIIQ
jgi:hypothetical protein